MKEAHVTDIASVSEIVSPPPSILAIHHYSILKSYQFEHLLDFKKYNNFKKKIFT